METGPELDLELPNFQHGTIEWKMCMKIAELTQVIQLLFTRSEANDSLTNRKSKEIQREAKELKEKLVQTNNEITKLNGKLQICEDKHNSEMKEIMDSYHRERVDADRHLKERNRIAKRYFDLEKKYQDCENEVDCYRKISDNNKEQIKSIEAALTYEKLNTGKLRSELHAAKSSISRREMVLNQHQENIQKISTAFANSERHRAALQEKIVGLQRLDSRSSMRMSANRLVDRSSSRCGSSMSYKTTGNKTTATQTDDYLTELISGYENNIFTLEEKLRSAQSSLPIPLQIGFMEIPVRKRLPSRAGTARLRRLGDIGVNSQRAVTALPTRPLSVSNLIFPNEFRLSLNAMN